MKELVKDLLTIRQYENRAAMDTAAAQAVAECIREKLKSRDTINMIFAAAPSQNEMLAALVTYDVTWNKINAFHMDEYIGLPVGATQSFRHYLDEHLFSLVNFRTVNYINGNAADLKEECHRYSGLLSKFPPDIVCMGIGENGHLAFNDPHVADFKDTALVKVVDLDEVCRQQQVNDGCFEKISFVPTQALTLTIPSLMKGQNIFCVVPGNKKATAVRNTINQPVDEKFPSTILRTHRNATLFVDEDSYKP
ncbi:MAG TPA: glucosamine-6-phosphate deaminase [Cyclobacteriaceae bacterium]|nr:glucosamine-6-phosphate deaminase [Cyclobacteriaceae bacterium]